ncbi:unnamed protein product [Callosobruchus maculatus]|nr:unnamed protein product [Callosobruchus maculatus]
MKLFAKCKSEIFLTNDVIVLAGSPGHFMYFINFGTVAVYSPSGREICHLEDGAHIGEIAFIFDEVQQTTVVAVAPCEMFKLKKADYDKVLDKHPDVKQLIVKRATQRWNEYKKKAQ